MDNGSDPVKFREELFTKLCLLPIYAALILPPVGGLGFWV